MKRWGRGQWNRTKASWKQDGRQLAWLMGAIAVGDIFAELFQQMDSLLVGTVSDPIDIYIAGLLIGVSLWIAATWSIGQSRLESDRKLMLPLSIMWLALCLGLVAKEEKACVVGQAQP